MFISKDNWTLNEKRIRNCFPVDGRIANHVLELNKKGYYTYLSFQGSENPYSNLSPYIMMVKAYEFETTPTYWNIDYVNKNDRIRAIIEVDMEAMDIVGYDTCMESLLKWINELNMIVAQNLY